MHLHFSCVGASSLLPRLFNQGFISAYSLGLLKIFWGVTTQCHAASWLQLFPFSHGRLLRLAPVPSGPLVLLPEHLTTFKMISISILSVCVRVRAHACEWWYPGSQKRTAIPGAGMTGSCQLPEAGAKNQSQALCQAARALNCCAVSPAL